MSDERSKPPRNPLQLSESQQLRSRGPSYWAARAQEISALADKMEDPEIKRDMLCIAVGYDRMAREAETRAALKTAVAEPHG